MSDSGRVQPVSISFSGSGFLATYQLGVVQALLENAPWILRHAPRVYGASAGSLVAAAVACGADIGRVREELLVLTRDYGFGLPQFSRLDGALRRTLPKNAHRLAHGRLHISMTRIPDGHNILASEFHSNEDLIRALLCSCFVPVFCGMVPPSYKGVHYMDGGLTNIQPTQDSCPTLTVSPFSGDVDICPSDPSSSSFCDLVVNRMSVHATLPNFVRVANALFPRDRRALNKAFYSGYQDTLYFLQHSRWVRPYPGWVSELERVVVKPEEWMFPQLEQQEVEAEELVLESPLEVVTENSRVVNVEKTNNQNLLNPSNDVNPPGQALEVLICNLVANLGMISILSVYLPQRSLPYLLLPLSIIIWATTSFTSRVEPWVLSVYQVVYWIWQDTKHMMWFILGIIVSTVQRAIQHRMLMLFLNRTKDFRMEKSHLSISPSFRHNPSIPPSLHALLFTLEMRRRQRESRQNVP